MISRELFKEVLEKLQSYQQKETAIYRQGLDLMEVTESLIGAIFILLKDSTNDEDELISFFCYDLDFGKDWQEGCVTEDGKDIKLQTVDDLYNILLDDEAKRNPPALE